MLASFSGSSGHSWGVNDGTDAARKTAETGPATATETPGQRTSSASSTTLGQSGRGEVAVNETAASDKKVPPASSPSSSTSTSTSTAESSASSSSSSISLSSLRWSEFANLSPYDEDKEKKEMDELLEQTQPEQTEKDKEEMLSEPPRPPRPFRIDPERNNRITRSYGEGLLFQEDCIDRVFANGLMDIFKEDGLHTLERLAFNIERRATSSVFWNPCSRDSC